MSDQVPDHPVDDPTTAGQPSETEEPPRAARARDCVEMERLKGRQRRAWRVILALLVSVGLLLLALGLRRDQVVRESALDDLRQLTDRFQSWVAEHGTLPENLRQVYGESSQEVIDRFDYAAAERREHALVARVPVILLIARKPTKLAMFGDGRPVLLCRGLDFQVKWLTEQDVTRQHHIEDRDIAKLRELRQTQIRP